MPHPFGIAAGSTPDASIASYFVTFDQVPNPHPSFVDYHAIWQPELGVTKVIAASRVFEDDTDGTYAMASYQRVKLQLMSVYGNCSSVEQLFEDATFDGPEEFATSIQFGERMYTSIWNAQFNSNMDSGIYEIVLNIQHMSGNDLRITLAYDFLEKGSSEVNMFGADVL